MRKIPALAYLLFFTISLLLISSCQKEPSAGTPPETSCQLSKAYYFDDSGNIGDSLLYTYTDNKLVKMSNPEAYFTFEYTNNKIVKRNYYETGFPGLAGYDIATYNADGTFATIKSYLDYTGQLILYTQFDFSYANGKLAKFEIKQYDFITSKLEPHASSTFTYTGNNITECITTDFTDGSINTYNYSYDNIANYFAKNNPLFTDFAFIDGMDGAMLPFALSPNNVTKMLYDGDESAISYKLDGKNNLHELFFYGELASRYFYDCK